ncbi:MAG: inositol monophosphatase family protein [Acidimicrobiia bacterium]
MTDSAASPEAARVASHVAAVVADAVRPHLGTPGARARVSVAPGGDATLAIDEIAEDVVARELRAVGDVGFYSEDQGLVLFGEPRYFLVIDPVDGTRPAAAGLEACAVSIGVTPPREDATLGDVAFGVVHELKTGDRYWAARGGGAHGARAGGVPIPLVPSANTDLRSLFWTAGLRGRPSLPMAVALEELSDACSMGGGTFELGSAAFALTRVANGQLDAYVDVGRRALDTFPALEPAFLAVGEGAVCTNFPYDVAAGALILEEAGGVATRADGSALAPFPAIGSGRDHGLDVLATGSAALHSAILTVLERGMGALGAWLARTA